MCKPFRSQCDYHCRGSLLQSRCLESALKYPSCGSIKFIQHSVVSQNFSRLSVSWPSYKSVVVRSVWYDKCTCTVVLFEEILYVRTSNHLHIPSVHIIRVWLCCTGVCEPPKSIQFNFTTSVQFHPCLTATVHSEREAFPPTLPWQWTECWALLCSGSRGVSAICGLLVQCTCRRRTTSRRGCPLLPGLSVLHPPSSG